MKSTKSLAALALILASAGAMAENTKPTTTPADAAKDAAKITGSASTGAPTVVPSGDFAMFDSDGDGSLTRKELRTDARLNSKFKTIDTNGDGKLSSAEFSAYSSTAGGTTDAKTDVKTK